MPTTIYILLKKNINRTSFAPNNSSKNHCVCDLVKKQSLQEKLYISNHNKEYWQKVGIMYFL